VLYGFRFDSHGCANAKPPYYAYYGQSHTDANVLMTAHLFDQPQQPQQLASQLNQMNPLEHQLAQKVFDLAKDCFDCCNTNNINLVVLNELVRLVEMIAKTNLRLLADMIVVSYLVRKPALCTQLGKILLSMVDQNVWPVDTALRNNLYSHFSHNQALLTVESMFDALALLLYGTNTNRVGPTNQFDHIGKPVYVDACWFAVNRAQADQINQMQMTSSAQTNASLDSLVELVKQKLNAQCCVLYAPNTLRMHEMLFVGWFDGKLGGFVASPDKLHHYYDDDYMLKNAQFMTSVVSTADQAGQSGHQIQASVSPDQSHVMIAACQRAVLAKLYHKTENHKTKIDSIVVIKEFNCLHAFWVGKDHFCLLVQGVVDLVRSVYDVDNLVVVDSKAGHSVSASCSHVMWVWCESVPDSNGSGGSGGSGGSKTDYTWSVQVDDRPRVMLDELAGWMVYAKAWTSSNPDQFVLVARKPTTPTTTPTQPTQPCQLWLFDASTNTIGLIDA
jgi:hypothetical protein